MTTQDLINYYANLLVLQYIGRPKAYATIQTLVTPVIMDQLPTQVENAFDITTAVGVQLDVLGKYAGVTRTGYGPNGPITLDDSDFSQLITLAIVDNTSNSSLYSIQQLLNAFFAGEIFVFDGKNMELSYFLSSDSFQLNLATLFITEGLLPKPLGVALASVIYAPTVDLNSFFGCVTYQQPTARNNSPCNTYQDYETGRPVLLYQNALQV